jgi:hypothetical protein
MGFFTPRKEVSDDLNPNKLTSVVNDYLDMLFGDEDKEVEKDMRILDNRGVDTYVPEKGRNVGDGFTVTTKHRDSLSS